MKSFKYIISLLFLFLSIVTYGLQPRFRHYTVENGLSNNSVQCIIQDRNGFIWSGTSDGLNRFDSRHFKTFRHILSDSTSLGNNNIHSLLEDSDGHLWIGTEDGVFRYNPSLETFSAFPLTGIPHKQLKKIVYDIKEDFRKNIWITVFGNGVFCYNPTKNELKHYQCDPNNANTISSNLTTKMLVSHDGEVWIATHGCGICKYTPASDNFTRIQISDPETGESPRYIFALCEDSYGNIWMCDNNLFRYNKNLKTGKAYITQQSGNLKFVHYIIESQPGTLLIGSNTGLTQYNIVENSHYTITYDVQYSQGLNDLFVYSILRDKEGGTWVGTYSGGLNYLPPATTWFTFYAYTSGEHSAPGKIINTFHESPNGEIYIGTDDHGVWLFNPHTQNFRPIRLDKDRKDISIHSFYSDQHELWIGTYARGLYRINHSTGKITLYGQESGTVLSSIYSIFKDSSGKLWIGTQTGIHYYDPPTDSFITLIDLGYNSYVGDIIEDAQRNIWFASQGKGLISYNLQTNKLSFHSNHETGLPEIINTLCLDQGKLRIGTGGYGLFTYQPDSNRFIKHTDPVFNQHTTIHSIIPGQNELWITSNIGLLKYDIVNENITSYNQEDGLESLPFNSNAGLRSSTGKIYLGGSNGFNIFNPQDIKKNEIVPAITFTAFRIFNEDVPIGEKSILKSQIDAQREVVLPHDHAVFSIEFIATSYCAPSKNKYKYRLKGFDKYWNYTDNQNNIATYTNLSPGSYTFRIMACNNDEIWSKESQIFIKILPPWWASGLMLCVYAILIILSLALGYMILLKRTNKEHRAKIEALHHENERKLFEDRISLFTNITHEIRTPVSLILAPVEEIMRHKNIPEAIQGDLEVVKKNSERLIELVNQLLDFTKAGQGSFIIQNTTFDICRLVKETVKRFIPSAQQKGILLHYECTNNLNIRLNTDKEALTKILSNLLTNAMKFTKDKIVVYTEENKKDKTITLIVEDNGIGIKQAEKEKIFKTFYQSEKNNLLPVKGFGIGLSIVNLLAKQIGAIIKVDSEENKYTRFSITLPIDNTLKTINPELTIPMEIRESIPETADEMPISAEIVNENSKQSGTALIVEDNEEFITYLTKVIGKKYNIQTTGNGKEALEMLENIKPDIIISDIMMPVMDGIELCQNIKSDIRLSHIPVILLTAKTDTESKISGLENGADVYIEKPVSVNYLYAQMESLLENRNKLRNLFSQKPFTPITAITETKADEAWLMKLNEIIEENISNAEFSVDQLARNVNMSRTLLYTKVKAVTGLTPNDFIRLIRLRKAAGYLAGNEYKINEICYMVGFNSPSYFSKCFQVQFGVLPKDFYEANLNQQT